MIMPNPRLIWDWVGELSFTPTQSYQPVKILTTTFSTVSMFWRKKSESNTKKRVDNVLRMYYIKSQRGGNKASPTEGQNPRGRRDRGNRHRPTQRMERNFVGFDFARQSLASRTEDKGGYDMNILNAENAKTAKIIRNINNPEWGNKKFSYNAQSLTDGRFESVWGVGPNSAVLFESEYKFWEVVE